MDWIELGKFVGAAVAAFAASQAAMGPRLKEKLKEPQDSLALLKQKQEAIESQLSAVQKRQERIDERLARSVTDEEFQAYVATTNQSVQGLTEKVGKAAGAIEAWYRSNQ